MQNFNNNLDKLRKESKKYRPPHTKKRVMCYKELVQDYADRGHISQQQADNVVKNFDSRHDYFSEGMTGMSILDEY